MNFEDFIAKQNATVVQTKGIGYRVGPYYFSYFVWNESTCLFSKKSDPPPLASLKGRSVVAVSGPAGDGKPPFWFFLNPESRYWNFQLPKTVDQKFIQHLGALERPRPEERREQDRLYPQYERST